MKRHPFLYALLAVAASVFIFGCEAMDMVRANPVSLEVNGKYFRSRPDTSSVLGGKKPDAAVWQSPGGFGFVLHETLFSKKDVQCIINLEFTGDGAVQTGVRYPLNVDASPSFSCGRDRHEVTEGWVEFSEYGINDSGDRAYVSGTFGVTLSDRSVEVTNGTFGRLLECSCNIAQE